MDIRRQNRIVMWTQGLIWLCVFLIPGFAAFLYTGDTAMWATVSRASFFGLFPIFFFYALNFFWLIPHYLFSNRKAWFYVLNTAIVLLFNGCFFTHIGDVPDEVRAVVPVRDLVWFYVVTICLFISMQVLGIVLAIGARYVIRWNEARLKLTEKEKEAKEAELNWLRYQLNPHFLFNTMNNISSLTQIDPDLAQESLGRLSDVLRYALYETNNQFVPLAGEVDFMQDYISLMKLRCNELTTVTVDLRTPPGDVKIAPLLFISLIENAFKHGVNARMESFVEVRMSAEGHDLAFTCRNSLFEKAGEDHIGSGIGVENLRKRLDLIYPGRYLYERRTMGEAYEARLVLKDLI